MCYCANAVSINIKLVQYKAILPLKISKKIKQFIRTALKIFVESYNVLMDKSISEDTKEKVYEISHSILIESKIKICKIRSGRSSTLYSLTKEKKWSSVKQYTKIR